MAPAYKLTYFDVPGLAEPIRFILSYGGIEFEDNRIKKENWPALKPSIPAPLGHIPILEHNGKVGHQSVAICRYLAKQAKLAGKDDWENLEIDATIDSISDLRQKIGEYSHEQDEKLKDAKEKTLFNETIPFYFEKFDAQVKKNSGYLVGGRLTWVDLYFAAMLESFLLRYTNVLDNYPNLRKLNENVFKLPNIKRWIEKRPKEN